MRRIVRSTTAGLAAAALAVTVGGAASGATPHPASSPVSASPVGAWKLAGTSATAAATPLPIGTGWGPTAAEIEHARQIVDGLTLSERAGQVLVASYTGSSAPAALVNELHLGGVVTFASNITSVAQVRAGNQALQQSAAGAGREYPVLIGVDQEGGRVARLTSGATRFPTFMTAGAARDLDVTQRAYAASGGELGGVGFTTDFAPDADVTMGASDPTIGARSAGSTPTRVGRQTVAAMRGLASSGMITALKHFPGHGSVSTDSHLGLPVQNKSLAALRTSDLVPFKAGIAAGASSVMVGHLDVRAVDPGVPSSLSRKVVTGLLRGELGFNGVAVTDSLQMHAVVDRYGVAGAAVKALHAGDDILLMPGSPRVARDGIVAAVHSGKLTQERLDQAATRMVALLLHQKAQGLHTRPAGSSRLESRQLSDAGITSVKGACSGRLVGSRVHVTGPAAAVAEFTAGAHAAGLATGSTGRTVRLVGYPSAPVTGDIVVAMDTPYVLGRSTGRVAKIATYGETRGAMRSLVALLLGRAKAPGTLPVAVSGLPRTGC